MNATNEKPGGAVKLRRVSMSWFLESDWVAWCAIDPEFQPSYAYWLKRSEEMFARHKAEGVPIFKVTLDPIEFMEWSKATGAGVGTMARATFAAFKGMSIDHGEGMH
jgi:hypothetical protein